MDLNEYQTKAAAFALDVSPIERVFGLVSEAGEVAGCFQRAERGDYNFDVFSNKLAKELGDVLWYLSKIAHDNGWELSQIAQDNLEKLESRKIRGLILGSGDNR